MICSLEPQFSKLKAEELVKIERLKGQIATNRANWELANGIQSQAGEHQ